jgi:hypothetical protein
MRFSGFLMGRRVGMSCELRPCAQGPTYVATCDEAQLMEALYYFGPLSVYVKAECQAFQVTCWWSI